MKNKGYQFSINMKIILSISVFCLFFVSGLKAQNRGAARIDSLGNITYTSQFNHPQPTPANNTAIETHEAPTDTFNVKLQGQSLKISPKDIEAKYEKATENSPQEPVKK